MRGFIAWIHGQFPTEKWPDISIFRDALKHYLGKHERVEADDGYRGETPGKVKYLAIFANLIENERMQQRVRSRHETVNKHFKQWGILNQIYCRNRDDHVYVYRTIVVLTQLSLKNGEPLLSVNYKDPKQLVVLFVPEL